LLLIKMVMVMIRAYWLQASGLLTPTRSGRNCAIVRPGQIVYAALPVAQKDTHTDTGASEHKTGRGAHKRPAPPPAPPVAGGGSIVFVVVISLSAARPAARQGWDKNYWMCRRNPIWFITAQ
jgi:hypothetical protein